MRRFQISLLLCAAILGAVLVRGQNPATSDDEIRVASAPYTPEAANAITVQSNLVEVGVVIRDDHGKPVRGLKQEDFLVFDSSRPQKISHFSVEEESPAPTPAPVIVTPGAPPPAPPPAPQPRYIGFYFDDNNMETPDLVMVRKAAKKFVADHLQPTDKAAVFTSSATVTQNFTNDRDKLSAAIDRVYSHYRKASYGSGSCPHIEPYQAYQIVQMWDVHSQPFDLALAEAVKCNCHNPTDVSCSPEQLEPRAGAGAIHCWTRRSVRHEFSRRPRRHHPLCRQNARPQDARHDVFRVLFDVQICPEAAKQDY